MVHYKALSSLFGSSHFLLCNKLFFYMCPMVLEWNPETLLFSTKGRCNRRYWLWYFNIFVIAGIVGFGSCIVVITHPRESGYPAFIMSCFLATLSCLTWSTVAIVSWHAQTFIEGFANFKKYWQELKRISSFHRWPQNQLFSNFLWQITHLSQKVLFLVVSLLPFTFAPLTLFVEMDPFYFTLPKLFPALQHNFHSLSGCSTFALRVYFSLVCVTEACRFLVIFGSLVLGYWAEMTIRTLEILNQIPLLEREQSTFKCLYSALTLVHKGLAEQLNLLIGTSLGIGFVVLVICNVAVVKAVGLVPFEIYWMLPVVAVMVACIYYVLLPLAVKIKVLSDMIVEKRKKISGSSRLKRQCTKREFVSLLPIGFSCGNFYPLETGSEASYFYWVIYRTTDCCVMLSL